MTGGAAYRAKLLTPEALDAAIATCLTEYDFRYNNRLKPGCGNAERAERALRGIVGKRLMHQGAQAKNLNMV